MLASKHRRELVEYRLAIARLILGKRQEPWLLRPILLFQILVLHISEQTLQASRKKGT